MATKTISLGKHETKLLFSLEEKEQKVFTFKDALEILALSKNSTAKVIYRLKKKGRIKEIERGKYLLIPARAGINGYWSEDLFVIVDSLLQDYYIGFINAMSYWGLTDQLPRKLLVATPKRKRKINFEGIEIKFITLSRNRFFGYVVQEFKKSKFKISSIEKTIADCLLHPEYCNGIVEVVKAISNANDRINWNELLKIVRLLKTSVLKRRLGYILELLDLRPDIRNKLKDNFKGFRWLDPSYKKQAKAYDKNWGLMLNLTPEEIMI